MTAHPRPAQRPALARAADGDLHPTRPKGEGVENLRTKAGSATSDVMRPPKKDKQVSVKIEIPKSVRTSLIDEATRRGMSLPQLINAILRDRVRK